jgi:hypothetical protein
MNPLKITGLIVFSCYACTSSQQENTALAVMETGQKDYALCGMPSTAYQLPGSIALPLVQTIPGFRNEDSLIAFLQNEADYFSWKTFIALNWVATENGTPDSTVCFGSREGTTVWEHWMPSTEIFKPDNQPPSPWQHGITESGHPVNSGPSSNLRIIGKLSELTNIGPEQSPVIDKNRMYTLYENFYNQSAYNYVVAGKLYNLQGQKEFVTYWPSLTQGLTVIQGNDTLPIEKTYKRAYFSVGNAKDSIEVKGNRTYYFTINEGAVIIKSAWVILTPQDDPKKFHTRATHVEGDTVRTLGLVGMHIMHKVAESTQWVWSSFEHIYNAPTADSTGIPQLEKGVDYLYFDEATVDTHFINKPPSLKFQKNSKDRVPTQVVSVRDIEKSTKLVNDYFHQLILANVLANDKNSVWLNYRLVGTQWPFETELFTSGSGYQPEYMANAILETYHQATSSCLSCHSKARFNKDKASSGMGYSADFVYELGNVK